LQNKQHHFSSLDALRLGLRLVLAFASPIVTALPASALPHNSPLAIAHRQESLTAGGPFDPAVPFAAPGATGADPSLQRGDDLR
jgi:hypothetical protein